MSGWQAVSDQVLEIRARWRDAPAKLGPFSRHPRSVELLRHARADVLALLGEVDSTQGDEVGRLMVELARAGAERIALHAVRPLAGQRGLYEVTWCSAGVQRREQGWAPSAALRKALRRQAAGASTDARGDG